MFGPLNTSKTVDEWHKARKSSSKQWFVGFDLNYVMSYSEEVSLRYHKLKAEHRMKGAKQAEQAMLKAASSPQNFNKADEDSETESETAVEIRKAVAENNMDLKISAADNCDATNSR